MSKEITVADGDTDLAEVIEKRRQPAPASSRAAHDLAVGGSTIGTAATDDDFALDNDGDGRRELVELNDDVDPAFPQVAGHTWAERDIPILESFTTKADELGLSSKVRSELASWFLEDAQQAAGVPEDASDYRFKAEPAIETSAMGRAMSGKFKEFALAAGLPVETADAAVTFFLNESSAAITAQDGADRDAIVDECRDEWGADHGANIKATRAYLDSLGELGRVLKNARTSSGRRLIYESGVPQLFHEMSMKERDPETSSKPSGTLSEAGALRKEASALRTLRDRDREAYYAEWRHSGMTASDRLLEIEKQLAGKVKGEVTTSAAAKAADLAEEKRALLKLERDDPESFEFSKWRGTDKTPEQRLREIATKGR